MAEGNEAGVADAEIEPHRGDGERHDHGAGVVREAHRRERKGERDHRGGGDQHGPVFLGG
jgi:hypothetical protein